MVTGGIEGEDKRSEVAAEPLCSEIAVDNIGWLLTGRIVSAGVGHGKVGVIDLIAIVDEVEFRQLDEGISRGLRSGEAVILVGGISGPGVEGGDWDEA